MPIHPSGRDFSARAYTVAVGGSIESGKAVLLLVLCRLLRDNYSIAVVTRQPGPDRDGSRDFLIRHKALAPTRIIAVNGEGQADLAIESLMTEFRPEIIFLEETVGDDDIDARADFIIHVVDGSGAELSPDDVIDVMRADLLVLNKTHLGLPLDPERHLCVRESVRVRGEAPYVFAQLRYGIGAIEIARQFLVHWRQTCAPAAWVMAVEATAALTEA